MPPGTRWRTPVAPRSGPQPLVSSCALWFGRGASTLGAAGRGGRRRPVDGAVAAREPVGDLGLLGSQLEPRGLRLLLEQRREVDVGVAVADQRLHRLLRRAGD